MSAVHLARIDPARNMCRFYRLDVQPDLFGGFAVVKEWGRIGARARDGFRRPAWSLWQILGMNKDRGARFGSCAANRRCRRRVQSCTDRFKIGASPSRQSSAFTRINAASTAIGCTYFGSIRLMIPEIFLVRADKVIE